MPQDNEIIQAMKQICEEKNITFESVVETIEAALAVAYRKDFGEKNNNIKVELDPQTTKSRIFDIKTVASDEKAEETEKLKQEIQEKKEKGEEIVLTEKIDRFNPKTEITLTEAKKIKKGAKIGDEIKTELFPPASYGRMAAQTAKQVIIQKLREAERDNIYKEYKGKEGEIINGTVQRVEGRMVLVDLGHATALLPPPEQIPSERYASGQRMKFFLVSVNTTTKGPELILSRAYPEIVKKLFAMEVPEVNSGSVEIKSVAREAGSRSKIAVATNQKNIDPVGSCVGQRGSRVQTVISEIGGEKIDIIQWDEDPAKFITYALSPAKVLSVKINEAEKTAVAEVKEEQLSLAIGKGGQNVRLSAKLTGYKIDIVGEGRESRQAKTEVTEKPVTTEETEKPKTTETSEVAEGTEKSKEKAKEDKTDKKTEVKAEKATREGTEKPKIIEAAEKTEITEEPKVKPKKEEKAPGKEKAEEVKAEVKEEKSTKETKEEKKEEKKAEEGKEPVKEEKKEEKTITTETAEKTEDTEKSKAKTKKDEAKASEDKPVAETSEAKEEKSEADKK